MDAGTAIVHPFIIYLIGLVDRLSVMAEGFIVFIAITLVVVGFITMLIYAIGDEEEAEKVITFYKYFNAGKLSARNVALALLFVFGSMYLFIPSSKTIVGMVVASHITYERVDMIGGSLKDAREEARNLILDISKQEDKLNGVDKQSIKNIEELVEKLGPADKKEILKKLIDSDE